MITVPIMSDGIRIKDLPENERPRERLAELGAQALRDAELIAILLRTGTKGRSAVQIADELLLKFGKLHDLARASLEDLSEIKGIGRDKAIALKSAFTLASQFWFSAAAAIWSGGRLPCACRQRSASTTCVG